MKGIYMVISTVLLITVGLSAQQPDQKTTAYKHLYEVNQQWQRYQNTSPPQIVHFDSDTERIAFHLNAVIERLKRYKPASIDAQALKKRMALIDSLSDYAAQKVFPQNIYHSHRQPYFIDHKGTHCAVGYLMKASGAGDLAQKIHQEHNYDYIKDIKTQGVNAWAKQHGFLLDELALIQPGYLANDPIEDVEGGTNGPIECLKRDPNNGRLYFGGTFDSIGGTTPCLNIGYYKNNQLHCIGNGLDGLINDIVIESTGEIVVAGDLIDNGQHFPMAIYNANSGWSYVSIPGRVGAVGTAVVKKGWWHTQRRELVIKHSSINGQEVWVEISASLWLKKITTTGLIVGMEALGDEKWYYGAFDSITVHSTNAPDKVLYSHNAILYNSDLDIYQHLMTGSNASSLSDTVKTVVTNGAITYFGGGCTGIWEPCVTRYLNGVMQPTIVGFDLMGFGAQMGGYGIINDLAIHPINGHLLLAGDFKYNPANGYFGSNLGIYNPINHFVRIFNTFDSKATSIEVIGTEIYMGGHFESCVSGPVNHLARYGLVSSVFDINNDVTVKAYPNPTTGSLQLDLDQYHDEIEVRVTNLLGQEILHQTYEQVNSIPLELEGDAGLYLVKLSTEQSESILKIVKNN